MNLKNLTFATALAFASAAVHAQSPSIVTPPPSATPTPGQHDHRVNQRRAAQQGRIAQGANSGQLTARESSHLEHQEAGIHREELGMRAQDNGHLTKQDRKTLHRQQNQESRRIYRDKHNARVQ